MTGTISDHTKANLVADSLKAAFDRIFRPWVTASINKKWTNRPFFDETLNQFQNVTGQKDHPMIGFSLGLACRKYNDIVVYMASFQISGFFGAAASRPEKIE